MFWGYHLNRALLAGLIIALLALACPQPAAAAPHHEVILTFEVVGVKEDESVTIRTKDFPVRTNFNVLMDKVGKQARGGKEAGEFNTGNGGVIELTFPIPEVLRGELILAIRFESKDGYSAANWFINENMAYKSLDKKIKPELSFSAVKKNQSAVVEGKNFPPGFNFSVRVGPYYTFYRDYIFVDSVKSNTDGTLKFELPLPPTAKDADYIMVRVDGGGLLAFNNFQNIDGGASVPPARLYKFEWCKVVATLPVAELAPGEEFDAVWTVQNTSNIDWEDSEPDYMYRFIGGEEMHKYEERYVFGWTVDNGAVFDIALDMIAPSDYAGWHSTIWAITQGDKEMCRLKISVFVKDSK